MEEKRFHVYKMNIKIRYKYNNYIHVKTHFLNIEFGRVLLKYRNGYLLLLEIGTMIYNINVHKY